MAATGLAPYSESLPKEDFAEWSFTGDGFEVSLVKVHYRHGGVAAWLGANDTLQYVLATDTRMALAWDRGQLTPEFADLRALTYVAPGVPVHARWRAGRMSRLLCRFDFERLATRVRRGSPDDDATSRLPENFSFDSPFIALMMRRLAQEILSPGFGAAFRIDSIVMAIFIDLSRMLDSRDTALSSSAIELSPLQIRTVHTLISAAETPTVDALGAAFKTSGRRLSALYRYSTGTTLRACIADARVGRAQVLLLEPGLRIKTIAHRCGFKSTAAFGSAFRRVTAVTPQQYRDATSQPV